MARPTVRQTARIMLVSVCTLALVAIFGAIVRQSWITNSAAAEVVRLEGNGAELLHPMTSLLAKMVETQSAAVRGDKVDAAGLREAIAKVGEIDGEYGAVLQTRQRFTDLTAQVEAALVRGQTGRAAYNTYSDLVTLTTELYRRIGDRSHLIHDPDLDSYYLMDAAIVRLPDAMVLAGRASDLVALAGTQVLAGEDAVRAAVARFGVSAAAEQVSAGLTTSVDNTTRAELGGNIAERLDTFKAAADAFAPPTMLAELSTTVDASSLAANARRVSAAANPLAHLLLHELQVLLEQRATRLAIQWRFTAVSAVLVGVIGLVMLWFVAVVRPRTPGEPKTGDIRRTDAGVGSLTYARQLLEDEELVHVGRAVRPRSRGSDAG